MKYIILLLLISGSAFGQVDSSKLPITLTFKEKHIQFMGDMLRKQSTLLDARVRDSLVLYLGAGNTPERVITTRFTAGFVLRFCDEMMLLQTGTGYGAFNELVTAVTPWPGIVAQLMIKSNQVNSEQLISKWLYSQAGASFNAKSAVWTEIINSGKLWLQTPIQYN